MNHLSETTTQLIYPLGWAIVHSLWQGLGIFLLLKLALSLIPVKYSSARYYSAIGALGLLLTAFIGTFIYQYSNMVVLAANTGHSPAAVIINTDINANAATRQWWQELQNWYNMHTAQVVTIYLTGIALFLFRIVYNLVHISSLKTQDVSAPDNRWNSLLEQSIASLKVTKQVNLLFSSKVSVPMVMGVIKPVILIPVALSTQLTTEQAEAILLHELAHVKRNDFLINIIQMFVETILFYNPFIWLISTIVRKEREHCCDDAVVMASGAKLPYVKALAALETYRQMPMQPSLSAKGSKQHLLTRIKRIMEMRKHNINYSQLVAVVATILLMTAAVTFFTPDVQAQTKKNKDDRKTEKTDKQQKSTPAPANSTTGNNKPVTKVQPDEKPAPPTPEEKIKAEALQAAGEGLSAAAEALQAIDFEEIINQAFESIDWDSLGTQIQMELDDIDWDEMNAEIKAAMAEAREEMAEAREEMAEARSEMRMSSKSKSKEIADANRQIAEASKQIAAASKRIADARRLTAEAMAEARRAQAMANREANDAAHRHTRVVSSSSHDHILKSMERDGLIDLTKRYKVQKKGNELYINGIKQSEEVYKKYSKMFKLDNVTIKGSHNSISIRADE